MERENEGLKAGDLLTVAQVREVLPLPRSTLYALIETGVLPGFRVPGVGNPRGRIFVMRSDLESFVREMRLKNRTGSNNKDSRWKNAEVDADTILARINRGD